MQGRGSAANSAVCYSLGITAVDPVGMELLFERFLSEERGEWPDIDLDLPSGDRRERVIQYVYERYGQLGAAMTANVITYRNRSATREVGKALGFDADLIDRLAKLMHRFEFVDSSETLARHLREVGVDSVDPRMRQFADLWHRMQDLPRHLGQHSGGMVICQDRLDQVVPLENASMPGRVVVQWDKEDCADMGLIKVDLLGLGMMSVLQDALVLDEYARTGSSGASGSSGSRVHRVHRVHPDSQFQFELDLAHLPPDDPVVYKMLQEADTIGLFQVESRAQMATLPRLKPACFYDIVVQVAIIRPGPIVGQMVHPYLNRRAGREPVTYAHPSLEPILRRTLGVPLFQEQLLRMAMAAAGFTGGTGRRTAAGHGVQAIGETDARHRTAVARRDGPPGHHGRGRRADHHLDCLVCAVRVSRVARRQLRAHRVRQRVSEGALPGGVLHGAAQQPADGVLPSGDAGEGRAAARRALCARRRRGLGLGLHDRAGRPRAPGPALCRRPARAGRPRHRLHRGAAAVAAGALPQVRLRRPLDARRSRTRHPPPPRLQRAGPAPSTRHRTTHPAPSTRHDGNAFATSAPTTGPCRSLSARKFVSPEDLIRKTGARRDELTVLAEIGALAAFGYDRRAALWQIEKAVRPEGEMFELPIDDCRLTITDRDNAQVGESSGQLAEAERPAPASESVQSDSIAQSAKFRQSAIVQSAIVN